MNNIENLVKEYANMGNTTGTIVLGVISTIIVLLLLAPICLDEDFQPFGCIFLIFMGFLVFGSYYHFFYSKSIDLKKEYNVVLEEKQNKLELSYNKKEDAFANARNKFKVVFTKDNEEDYYVYLDEKADEKKSTSFKEIQQFVKGQVDYEYYESLENFRLKDLSKNKNKQKEEAIKNETDKATIDELQKKLDELKKKENTKKEVSDKETNTEQLQKQLDELKKKIDKKNTDE